MSTLARGLGHILLAMATMAFMLVAVLFLFGSYLLTWPILRTSPRVRKVRAFAEFSAATMTLIRLFAPESDNQEQ